MAKSSRATSTKRNRTNLRAKVFGPVEDARAQRLSAKLMELASQPLPAKPERMEVEQTESKPQQKAKKDATKDAMELDDEDEPKSAVSRKQKRKTTLNRVHKKRRSKASTQITFPKSRREKPVTNRNDKRQRQ